ncbi:MAG: hypothetical protein K2O24_08825 [Muribaculaceae bacterium]|nr:hypothetical protein [Muribaculaceae bacterium]
MAVFLIILGILVWIASIVCLWRRTILSPGLSFVALLLVSFARRDGYQLLPINGTILIGWLCMAVVVTLLTMMQPRELTASARGTSYMAVGSLTGIAVGLLASTFTASLSMIYSSMIVGVAAGVFFGYILYTNTPDGRGLRIGEGRFMPVLLAKGFPVAITVMQIGVALVLLLAVSSPAGL